jgi:protein-disulfide isomerase
MSKALHESGHATGSAQAKVKIAEYADFQCPACAASSPIVRQVLDQYKDSVYFEYHHFPLPMHNWSQIAAEAAEAAAAQGKFMEYHDLLFAKQTEWSPSNDAVGLFKKYAQEIGLDSKKFDQELDEHKYKEIVTTSYTRGSQLGVAATPTFFVNGKRVEGGLSLDDWKKLIDEELAKSSNSK